MLKQNIFVLFLFIIAFFNVNIHGEFIKQVYTSKLQASSVVTPQIFSTDATGIMVCILDRISSVKSIYCDLQHDVFVGSYRSYEEISRISIYKGAFNTEGVVLFNFTNQNQPRITDTFYFENGVGGSNAFELLDDFLNGNWYVQIHTIDNPDGEIRGQIEKQYNAFSLMDIQQTIPHSTASNANGVAIGQFTRQNPKDQMILDLFHTAQEPIGISVNEGAFGQVGGTVGFAVSAFSPVERFEIDYFKDESSDFLEDLQYLSVLTERNPKGAIRGQLEAIDYIPHVDATASLKPENVFPEGTLSDASGCALISYRCENRELRYFIYHTVENPIQAYIHIGDEDESGPFLFTLSSFESPIYGFEILTKQDEFLLRNNNLYFTIRSEEYPEGDGEIRGQLTNENKYWSYLVSTQIVPVKTNKHIGCAIFNDIDFDDNGIFEVDYEIHHSVPGDVTTIIKQGREGENTIFTVDVLEDDDSPIESNSDDTRTLKLDETLYSDLNKNHLYVEIISGDEYQQSTIGMIRGQINVIDPCTNFIDYQFTPDDEGTPTTFYYNIFSYTFATPTTYEVPTAEASMITISILTKTFILLLAIFIII
eukprot:TRINITY_DN7573_c4_g1_i1.p1 TRINITY_DN7573_c4_g1~~TRINITY_DN7573_c4_g1_i1.p1  ORF type:complete len:594 (+),score=182.27 TRINITY_DN7573_c4_g1_i1:95-1876(+)